MDHQDTDERDISREDLIGAYYALKENLHRRPSQGDVNSLGEFKVGRYLSFFGSWQKFLKEIGELTEFSYHFPQGTHFGHLLYILDVVGGGKIAGSNLSEEFVKFSGGYADGDLGNFQRQTKYKIQALMEMGVLVDYRKSTGAQFQIQLTHQGRALYQNLKPLLETCDLSFAGDPKTEYSWAMKCEGSINEQISAFALANGGARRILREVLLGMPAVFLMQKYLYSVLRKNTVEKSEIYADFFAAPFVQQFLDEHGLDSPTETVICRRLPFLFNALEVVGVLKQGVGDITVEKFVVTPQLVGFPDEEPDEALVRANKLVTDPATLSDDEVSRLRETYGAQFLTSSYWLEVE